MTTQELLKDFTTRLTELRKSYKETASEMVRVGLSHVFDSPYITHISWSQGTPGFCDGGPCNFYVPQDTVSIYVTSEFYEELTTRGIELEYSGDEEDNAINPYVVVHNVASRETKTVTQTFYDGTTRDVEKNVYVEKVFIPELHDAAVILNTILLGEHSEALEDVYGEGTTIKLYPDGRVEEEYYDHGY